MRYSIDEILDNTSGYIYYRSPRFDETIEYYLCGVRGFETDLANCIFIPVSLFINNEKVDSFNSVESYIKNGCRAFLFDEKHFADKVSFDKLMSLIEMYKDLLDLVIVVPDTIQAIFDMANYTRSCRMSAKTKYITITGSIGKTTTTEMLYGILSKKYNIYRGEPGANIKLRVAHKFLETEADVDYLLFECSGQGKGYLKYFSELIMPDAAIITKVSNENLGEYKTLENVAKEKCTLLSAMSKSDFAVINNLPQLRNESAEYECQKLYINEGDYELLGTDKDGSEFIYEGEKFYIPVVGLHQIDNAIRVIELAKYLGLTYEEICSGLQDYQAIGDRWVVDKYKNNVEFITDCPNNPSYDTLIANIKTFMDLYKDSKYKRIIITRIKALGDLEEQTYRKIAEFISGLPIQELICVGAEILSIKEYVETHSDIKVVYFNKPEAIDENDDFIKYLLNTLNFEQATLLKGQRKDGPIRYGSVKEILRKYLL